MNNQKPSRPTCDAKPGLSTSGLLAEQNNILRHLLATTVEMLPKHAADCGVHRAHNSYGDQYCDCKLPKLRKDVREFVSANAPHE